jgi:outer membrane protein TolC
MRMRAIILTVVAATLLVAPASPQGEAKLPRKAQTEESAKKVKELQKERISTLKEMADVISQLYQHGTGSFEEAYEARLMVLNAELDAADKESDRITLYKNFVDVSKKFENLAEARMKTGRGTQASVLKVKARRLEAEINLERAKAKEAQEAK